MTDELYTLTKRERLAIKRARKLGTSALIEDLQSGASYVVTGHGRPADLREVAALALILARRLDPEPSHPAGRGASSPNPLNRLPGERT